MKSRPNTGHPTPSEMRAECEQYREALRELAKIHLRVDQPHRRMGVGEPDWIGRLRKICHHVVAIMDWEIEADVEHVMAPELRAAYEQMAFVWQCLPDEWRLAEFDGDWWAKEAKSGMLATYDHPTGLSLTHSAGWGGFGARDLRSDIQLAHWLGRLAFGYGLALVYLAQVLKASEDVESRVSTVLGASISRAQ